MLYTDISSACARQDLRDADAVYVAGGLKHVGAGANLAFAVIPASVGNLRCSKVSQVVKRIADGYISKEFHMAIRSSYALSRAAF